jgi:peptide/nickel transport system substrate-binding protein
MLAVVLLAACGPAASPTKVRSSFASRPALEGATGGTATVVLDQIPTTLNDHTVAGDTASARDVASAIWPQVFQIGAGQTPVLDTAVVTSAELVSVSPQTVVYQIAPNATWSDGVPISVNDFVYAWQSQRGGAIDVDGTPDSVASTLGYRDIASVTGSNGGKTVTVVFRTPYGDWESLFDDLLPAHIAERVGWNHGFDSFNPEVLVSGGPWLVESWEPGSQIVLDRNPHWWGTPPRLDRIVLDAAPGQVAMVQALRSGAADVGYSSNFDSATLAQLSSTPDLETRESLGTTMLQLVFNARHAPLDNVDVRQGIAHAIDRAGIISTLVQPLDPEVWEDNNHLFANAQSQYVADGAGYVQADPATANSFLVQGGLLSDASGTWTLHGAPVTLKLVWAEDDPWSAAVEPAVAAQLVGAGFDVSAVPLTSTQLIETVLPSGTFDLAIAPVETSAFPTETARYFTSTAAVSGSSADTDWSDFSDPKLDALLTQAAQTLGSNQSQPLYRQVDQELWADMSTLPLFAEPTLLVHSASVRGVQDDRSGLGPLYSFAQWFRIVAAHRKSSIHERTAARSISLIQNP